MRTGVVDVYSFLESVDPKLIDFWEAFDSLYPLNTFDDGKYEFATMAASLSRLLSAMAASHGVEVPIQSENDFLPKRLRYRTIDELQDTKQMQRKLTQGLKLND